MGKLPPRQWVTKDGVLRPPKIAPKPPEPVAPKPPEKSRTQRRKEARALSPIGHIPKPPPGKAFWNPEYAVHIPWYPKSQEAWEVWREKMRAGMRERVKPGGSADRTIPRRFERRREEFYQIREKAKADAKKIVAYMKKTEKFVPDNDAAEVAVEHLVAALRAVDEAGKPAESLKDRVAAAKTLLEFTQQKPAQTNNLTVAKAEDWLTAVASEADADE